MQQLSSVFVKSYSERFCSLFTCLVLFSLLSTLCLSTGLLCMILYEVEIEENSPFLVTPDTSFVSSYPIVSPCIYPASTYIIQQTDYSCGNQTVEYFCPVYYSCLNMTGVPACLSNTLPCSNSTFCFDFIAPLPLSLEGQNVREVLITYEEGWIISTYIVSIIVVVMLVIVVPSIIIFRKRVSWVPPETQGLLNGDSTGRGSVPNLSYFDSYGHSVGTDEEVEPWKGPEIAFASVAGGIGLVVVFLIVMNLTAVAGSMEPDLPTLDELMKNKCWTPQDTLLSIRWRLSMHIIFSLNGAIALIVVTLLVIAARVRRIYDSIWNAKACCILWFLIIIFLITLVMITILVITL